MIYVKPAKAGLIVRNPDNNKPIPDEGMEVSENSYWLRRLLTGDVVKVEQRSASGCTPQNSNVTVVEDNNEEPLL